MRTHVYTRTTEVGTLVGCQVIIALYAPLKFFVVEKKDAINCTALSNNQLRISGTKQLCSARFILQKHIILRLLTDLEPIVLDRSRVENQPIY